MDAPKWIFPACFKWLNLTGHAQEFEFSVNQIYSRLQGSEYKIWSDAHSSSHAWGSCSSETYNIQFEDTSFRFADKYTDPIFPKSNWCILDFPSDDGEFKAMLDEIFKKHESKEGLTPVDFNKAGGYKIMPAAELEDLINKAFPLPPIEPAEIKISINQEALDSWKLPVMYALEIAPQYVPIHHMINLLNIDEATYHAMYDKLRQMGALWGR